MEDAIWEAYEADFSVKDTMELTGADERTVRMLFLRWNLNGCVRN